MIQEGSSAMQIADMNFWKYMHHRVS